MDKRKTKLNLAHQSRNTSPSSQQQEHSDSGVNLSNDGQSSDESWH